MKRYYVTKFIGAEEQGPFDILSLQTRIDYDEITPLFMYRAEDDNIWRPLYEIPEADELFDREQMDMVRPPLPPIPPVKPVPPAGVTPIPGVQPRRASVPTASSENARPLILDNGSNTQDSNASKICAGILLTIVLFFAEQAIDGERVEAMSHLYTSIYLMIGAAVLVNLLIAVHDINRKLDYGAYFLAAMLFIGVQCIEHADRKMVLHVIEKINTGYNFLIYSVFCVVMLLVGTVARLVANKKGRVPLSTPFFFIVVCLLFGLKHIMIFAECEAETILYAHVFGLLFASLLFAYKLGYAGYSGASSVWPMCVWGLIFAGSCLFARELYELSSKCDSAEMRIYMESLIGFPFMLPILLMGVRMVSMKKAQPLTLASPGLAWVPVAVIIVYFCLTEWSDSYHMYNFRYFENVRLRQMDTLLRVLQVVWCNALIWAAGWSVVSMVWGWLRKSAVATGITAMIALGAGGFTLYVVTGIARLYGADIYMPSNVMAFEDIFDEKFLEPWFYMNVNMLVIFAIMFFVAIRREKINAL